VTGGPAWRPGSIHPSEVDTRPGGLLLGARAHPCREPVRRSVRWSIPAIVVVTVLAVLLVHRWEHAIFDTADPTSMVHWLDHFTGPATASDGVDHVVGLQLVVAGTVDIDTSLPRLHAAGAATGIVLDAGGVVLTNNHVIEGAGAIRITDLGNGRTYAAVVLGRDRRHDIALLALRGADSLVTAPLGDSSQLALGEHVVGFGNAGGRGGVPSRAFGVVSALNASVTAADDLHRRPERLTGLIEVTAPLQPGDSGGPLVNDAGQVIGLDTAADAEYPTGADTGRGFAIPIDQALRIAAQLK
jgi:S1-C subfamily serine protease